MNNDHKGSGGSNPVANAINEIWQTGNERVFKCGRLLLASKNGVGPQQSGKQPHGAFQRMIETELTFGPRTAQRLMIIARNPVLTKATHASHLPTDWTILYDLSKMEDDALTLGLANGKINPKMSRRDVRVLRGLETAEPKEKSMPDDTKGLRISALKTKLIEANRQRKQAIEIGRNLTHDNDVLRVERDDLRRQHDARRADPIKAFNELWEVSTPEQRDQMRDIANGHVVYLKRAG
jgi:hypothetical protein